MIRKSHLQAMVIDLAKDYEALYARVESLSREIDTLCGIKSSRGGKKKHKVTDLDAPKRGRGRPRKS